jgi:N6-adenosine-specific RNA methylase IME4
MGRAGYVEGMRGVLRAVRETFTRWSWQAWLSHPHPFGHHRRSEVKRYRTIVADPPWHIPRGGPQTGFQPGARTTLPYDTMSLDEIKALPVKDWAETQSHIYLWTINAYVEQAYEVARAWGFKPSTLLTWCKKPNGIGLGGTYSLTTEHILFCRRGSLAASERVDTSWWLWPRGRHSAKPEAFLDLVEQVSPAPRLEVFARRARFGWDYWGDESLGTAEIADCPECGAFAKRCEKDERGQRVCAVTGKAA